MEVLLEQADGYVHSLVGDLEILHDEVLNLHDELCRAREASPQNSFTLRFLESKRDSTHPRLSLVKGELDSDRDSTHT